MFKQARTLPPLVAAFVLGASPAVYGLDGGPCPPRAAGRPSAAAEELADSEALSRVRESAIRELGSRVLVFRASPREARELVAALRGRFGAAGEEPEIPEDGPLEITFALENDNLLFGIYRAAVPGLDGNDEGRTHGTMLSVSRRFERHFTLGLEAGTTLFTQDEVPGVSTTNSDGTTRIHFNEQNRFLARLDIDDPRSDFHLVLGGGAAVVNSEEVTVGGTGQQLAFHTLLREAGSRSRLYDYVPDGHGIRVGVVLRVEGYGRHVAAGHPLFRVGIEGGAALEGNTILEGSTASTRVEIRAEIGGEHDAHVELAVEEELSVALTSGAVRSRTTGEVRLASDPLDFWIAFNVFSGTPNLDYTFYDFNNVTMTGGITVRAE